MENILKEAQENLTEWLENPYWGRYYNEAPSQECKDYIALQFLFSDTEDDEVADEMDAQEGNLSIGDWKYLLKYSDNGPERKKIAESIAALEGK